MDSQTKKQKAHKGVKHRRKRRKSSWGDWDDEYVPKRGTKELTPVERAM